MTSTEKLLSSYDALEADIDKLLVRYRKVKRDRAALLEACKAALAVIQECPSMHCQDEGHPDCAFGRLRSAINQAEQ